MESFLDAVLPKLLRGRATFNLHPHQGKTDLLAKLGNRLRGYAAWLPETWCIMVVVDRDDDACGDLKQWMEQAAVDAGLRTRTTGRGAPWRVVNRIAIEELEAWYFGDWAAVRQCYPRVPATIPKQAPFRDPDAIAGGTWEAIERVLQRAGYFSSGLNKMGMARAVGQQLDPARTTSRSFAVFRDAVLEAVT